MTISNASPVTLSTLSAALHNRELSSVELTTDYLNRIERHSDLNAFITVDPDSALKQAEEADRSIATGNPGPMTGIPIAHKDIFCTQGMATTCGSKMLEKYISPYDATVVERLKQAGAVTLGKTNMDEFAMGSSNENSFFGAVSNPWDKNRVPGGSSGGSAAAVAAGISPAATGTDTGGSIRQPASFCGLTGLKPTYGRVSRWGMIAFASSLDQAGPITRTAEDAAIMLGIMAGFDQRDSTSVERAVPDYRATLDDSLDGLTIGLPREYFDQGLDSEVGDAVERALHQLQSQGVRTVEIELPNSMLGIPCYYVIAPAEASSNLARFDGVRYGYRADNYQDLNELYCRSRTEGFGPEVRRRIMIGTYALSAGYYDAYYLKAQKLRRLIANDFEQAFAHCDLIVGPTAPTTAFRIGAKTHDPVSMYLNDIYTNAANLAGLPALSIPCGLDSQNLPIGLQLVGNYFDESRLLNVAHRFQIESDHHLQQPTKV
ncbi:MAG: Asp-tRNA(Asn)/Glu-tRNA(Gln) amidotransferase subunit GatA [Arenicellales bacterium]|jgi:aspartyl-tRNA(Asn)/glutamyl-tRNA(Gln) amidotransferase subunit A|nr:Asp-tRNA(Asn)/Glu-tRNA(Gln) amidotransferase subunit GatA [Arenicellales bacterium]MDP6290004.1 Asp-tRNA(Asn)/Glu-tRNA(Gln) amidotransferase subunit GatA [Arenicellales bacterium]MDP7155433.1 Asp-tRNA(Asn)/Glu-tRNA(Gln) amidotransferase subunit GatA [Arenicellales bacterium]MDP7283640.1 Asp-tRNA(Asn)/Glu-tRNA(Gln) amidotransferase subunit GatA [Arenicellales bacterium]MDP7481232.1 Asp-tRNA(Asn)/Glu-tRNA(Gln) amidotransferase subunit GatA [Arenicellales bacterium]|tara:strand:+ start:4790 stop:6256 length:1467 start_codon:yes stop_codon:yes gene_type:complete